MEQYNKRLNWNLIGWKIFYTDETIVSSEDSTWEEAPQDEVCCIKKYYEIVENGEVKKHTEIENGYDLYQMNDKNRLSCDLPSNIKVGGWLNDKKHWEIYDKAKANE